MSKTMKRIVALVLAGVMVFAFAACKDDTKTPSGGQQLAENGKLFADGTVIKLTTSSHASWPYKEDWIVWDYIEEATGATLEVQAIPSSDYVTKVNLMMASPETLPDVMASSSKQETDGHAESGAFIALSDNFDKMPNFMALLDAMGEEKKAITLAERTSGDGKVYMAQVTGDVLGGNGRSWLYRRDIFEKNNLEVPTNEEEFFAVARKLKEIYPDSYPICFRSGLTNIDVMGPMFAPYFSTGFYYDYNGDDAKWHFGAVEDTTKELIEFFWKLSDEGLVPPDYLTIPTNSWQEYITTDRGFMMVDYLARINFFDQLCQPDNPEFDMACMAPPIGGEIANFKNDPTAMVVCNTGDEDRIDNAIKFIDWMYSDEGTNLGRYGKEGETYELVDGVKKMIVAEGETVAQKYGFGTVGTYLRSASLEDQKAEVGEKLATEYGKTNDYTAEYFNPTMWLSFNDDERDVYDEYFTALDTYKQEMISKFLLKQTPITEWDKFVADCKDMGLQELLDIHTSAYNRAMGK